MKNEKLKKCNELKEKEVTSEENFNQKREKYLSDISDSSTTNNSGNGFQNILLIIFFWILISGIVTSNNSNKICGLFSGDRYRPSTLAFLFTPNGAIEIEFPNPDIGWKWSKYNNQKICINGDVRKKNYVIGDQAPYFVDNPRFDGYAD